jgi:Asp-tRNA(Asn)/Glu-tRNA(Gln) amidotransferase A subunit family amidase
MKQTASEWSLTELRATLAQGKITAQEAVRACLDRIHAVDSELHAFISVAHDNAMLAAEEMDTARAHGADCSGALWGVPIAIKDLVDVRGMRTTAASRVLDGEPVAASDAECVRRLRAAGAIVIGKTNLHEFAYGGSGAISAYGAVRNPLDHARVCGGSSSGSAAAVAAGMCLGALGTDTAGSVRLPAACCGVVGFKPTWGAVPVAGVIPLAWSYDHLGPLARTVEDAGALFAVLAGEPPQWARPEGLRCGVAREYFCEDLAPEVEAGFEAALAAVRELGWELIEVEMEINEDRRASNAESWAFHEKWVAERGALYDPGTLPRIVNGKKVRVEDYVEARRALELLRERNRQGVPNVDVVLTPTVPILPPTLGAFAEAGARGLELQMLRNTRPFNVLGWPTVSVPTARMVAVQVSAAWGQDWLALSAALELEKVLASKA